MIVSICFYDKVVLWLLSLLNAGNMSVAGLRPGSSRRLQVRARMELPGLGPGIGEEPESIVIYLYSCVMYVIYVHMYSIIVSINYKNHNML